MLVALVSASEPTAADASEHIADLGIAGASIVARQVDIALAAGCERIVCLAEGSRPSLVALQRRVEKAGAKFILAQNHRILAGAVTAADRLLVFAEGIVADPAIAAELVPQEPAILALSEDRAIPLGYERIDRDRAWAGVMLLRGSTVDKLNDLPGDIDCVSSLLRIGLQSAVPISPVDDELIATGRWVRISRTEEAGDWGRRQVREALGATDWLRPVDAIAGHGSAAIATGHGNPARMAVVTDLAAVGSVMASFAATGLDYPAAALVLAALGSFLIKGARSLHQVLDQKGEIARFKRWGGVAAYLLLDLAIAVAVIRSVSGYARFDGGFAIVVLLGLLHFLPLVRDDFAMPLLTDRAMLSLALAAAVVFSAIVPLTQLLATAVLIYGLFLVLRLRLTQV